MAYRVEFSGVTITCDSVGEAAFLARELATPVRAPEPRPTFVVPASTRLALAANVPPSPPRPAPTVTVAGRGYACRDCKGHFNSKAKTGPLPTFCPSCAGKQKGKPKPPAKAFREDTPIGAQK